MIRKDYKKTKLFLVTCIALMATWQGKRNLSWTIGQVSNQECSPSWLFIQCR